MPETSTDRLAGSLAEIRQLQDDHAAAIAANQRLESDNARLSDMNVFLQAQIDQSNRQAMIYAKKLIALAQIQKNVGMMMQDANEIVMMAEQTLLKDETPEQAESEKISAQQLLERISKAGDLK